MNISNNEIVEKTKIKREPTIIDELLGINPDSEEISNHQTLDYNKIWTN